MKKLILAGILTLATFNCFALDCEITTDSNGDGNYDQLVRSVPNVTNQDMVFIFKDGSSRRNQNIDIGNSKYFSIENTAINKSLDGSKIIAFGTQGSTVIVTARHVAGTLQDFESLSAGAYDSNAPFGVLIDYTTKLRITCVK
jgi:hypothetical protein